MNLQQSKIRLGELIRLNLRHKDLRQIDLAKHLQLSTSAVSQMITGRVSPDVTHFKKIMEYLRCSDDDITEMKALLTQIRSGMNIHLTKKNFIEMPVVCIDNLLKFCPVLEDLRTFINRNSKQEASSEGVDDPIDYEDVFEVLASGDKFDPPFSGSLTLLVDVEAFPKTTDVVLAKFRNNDKLLLKKFVLEDRNIYLIPFNGTADKQESKVDDIEWMRKVLKVTVEGL